MNTDADFLSRAHVSMDALMCECTGQCGPEVLGSIFNAVENQEEHDVAWISAITCSPHIQEIAADTQSDIKKHSKSY